MRLVALRPSVDNTLSRKLDIACVGSVLFRMSCDCLRAVAFLTVPWVGLQCVIVVVSDHMHTCVCKGATYAYKHSFSNNKVQFLIILTLVNASVQLMHINIALVTTKCICSIIDLLNTEASNDKQLKKV